MCCEDWQKRKIFLGVIILIFGLIWYLRDTGSITLEPFWPIIAMLAGIVILIKAFLFKPEMMKKRR